MMINRTANMFRSRTLMLLACCLGWSAPKACAMDRDTRILLVVLDGFRSDYLTPQLMPHLYPQVQRGVIGKAHHVALPSVTRVNASTLVTGCWPERHGLMANTIYVPSMNPTGGVSTASRPNLL